MTKQRPININPLSVRLPLPAWVSIMHRLSGLFVFLLIPALIWCLQESLASSERFKHLAEIFSGFWFKGALFAFLAAFGFHLIAGVRHLLMDLHIGETLSASRFSATVVLMMSALVALGVFFWIWG